MSLLDKASLVVTPNSYKESKLYSVIPNTTLGDMDVVRATTATRVNSAGLIESVAVNVPRIDYTNGSCPSILVEPQRTNLIFPSATLTTQTRTVTAVSHTLSFYGTGSIVLSGVHSATLTGTGANNRVTLTFTPTAGSLILTVTGSVTNAQLEVGSYPTSYIPTVASTVTRNADVISKTGISSLIGQTEGTAFVDFVVYNNNDTVPISLVNNNWYTGASMFLQINTSGNFQITGFNNTVLLISFDTGVAAVKNQRYKCSLVYNNTILKLFINGTLITTNTIATAIVANNLFLSLLDTGIDKYGQNYNSIQLYKTALSNTEMATLTTL